MDKKEMTLEELESAIYEAYYKKNPDGDARMGLWGEVMKAQEKANSRKVLMEILERYEEISNG